MSHKIEVETGLSNTLLRGIKNLFVNNGFVFHKIKLIKEILEVEQIKDFLRDHYDKILVNNSENKLLGKDGIVLKIKNNINIITISEKKKEVLVDCITNNNLWIEYINYLKENCGSYFSDIIDFLNIIRNNPIKIYKLLNIILKPDILKNFTKSDSRMNMFCKSSNSQRSILRLIKNKGRIDQFISYIQKDVLIITDDVIDSTMNSLSINNNSIQFNIGVNNVTFYNNKKYIDIIKKKRELVLSIRRGLK